MGCHADSRSVTFGHVRCANMRLIVRICISQALHILSERSRDNSRTPMQWSAEKNAGFSQAEPKVVWQSEWDSYELLLENYSDGKVDGTLRPYECKMMRSI